MTFTDAVMYSIAGILVVFFALVLLLIITAILGKFSPADKKKAAPAAPTTSAAPAAPAAPALARGSAGSLKLYDTPPREAAMVMALLADQLQTPLNQLRFISIREIKEDEE